MTYKKSILVLEGIKYNYSIRPCENFIKITVYSEKSKVSIFTVYFSYIESWGFDVYRPKTIEILIRFYYENTVEQNEFKVSDYPLLFQSLLDYYFKDSSVCERDDFIKKCADAKEN